MTALLLSVRKIPLARIALGVRAGLRRVIPARLIRAILPWYHFFFAFCAALFYGFPSRGIRVIGVTGTKGKTTVVCLLGHILRESGVRVSTLSSIGVDIGGTMKNHASKMTMPGRMAIQRFLHDARRAGAEYAILEVTSEGIVQSRHRFIKFHAAIFTGIHPEHIEAHGNFEAYLRAKLDLFWRLPRSATAVINREDREWQRVAASTAAVKAYFSSQELSVRGKQFPVRHLLVTDNGAEFDIGDVSIFSPLLGAFNVSNLLAVLCIAIAEHIALERVASAIASFPGVPGRMEIIATDPILVVVDYAHTPESLKHVYAFLRGNAKFKTQNHRKLICVLGAAGGGRDRWKRPVFGKIASDYCDRIILTNEDPYDEDPQGIVDDIERGLSHTKHSVMILDRREAIREALKGADTGDTVVVTGKGAERWIAGPGGTMIPWDEHAVVREEVERLLKTRAYEHAKEA